MKTRSFPLLIVFALLLSSHSGMAQKNNLLGNWQSSNGTIITFTNNQFGINGFNYNYQLLKNIIRTTDQYGNVYDYNYQIKNNSLYLVVPDDGTYILKRIQDQQTQNNSGTAGISKIYGSFCSYSSSGYSGSSSYSTTNRVSFDGRGNFVYGSESSYSGNGDAYSSGSGGEKGTYRVHGQQLILIFSDGSQYNVEIYTTNDRGEVTGLRYEGTIYAKSLCD